MTLESDPHIAAKNYAHYQEKLRVAKADLKIAKTCYVDALAVRAQLAVGDRVHDGGVNYLVDGFDMPVGGTLVLKAAKVRNDGSASRTQPRTLWNWQLGWVGES